MKYEQLAGLIAIQPERGQLLNLYRFYGQNLAHLLQLLERYEESTGQNPDRLLQQANGQPKAEVRARLKRLRQDLERVAGSTYPSTSQRSARYWLVYEFIVSHIERYWVGPTRSEIKQGCRISSNHNVDHWLEKLESDGLIIRRGGFRRGLDLPT